MTVIPLNPAAAQLTAPTAPTAPTRRQRLWQALAKVLARIPAAPRAPRPSPRHPPLPAELADAEPWLLDDLGLVDGRVNARRTGRFGDRASALAANAPRT